MLRFLYHVIVDLLFKQKYFIIFFVFLGCSITSDGADDVEPILATSQGTIRGKYITSRSGRTVQAYLRIPYAEPPTGELRFKSPIPASKWPGVRDGTIEVESCPQRSGSEVIGSEDCLYLNVYVPRVKENAQLLPVMFFIHGGALLSGQSSSDIFGPQYLLDEDVVLVTTNYRLGRLGFLSLEDNVIPGNWGMKDQVMALKWVQKYISEYGGDPKRVTIFGQSAGGISVNYHLIVPASKGLFHQAITESGSVFNYAALSHRGQERNKALFFAKRVNCVRETSEAMLKCFQNLTTKEFFLSKFWEAYEVATHLPYGRGIVREPKTVEDAFLSNNPYDLMREHSDVPWINGINSAEGGLISGSIYSQGKLLLPFCDLLYTYIFPRLLGYKYTVNTTLYSSDEVSTAVYNYYFPQKFIRSSFAEFTEMCTDRGWVQPFTTALSLYTGPKYAYYYDYVNTVFTYASYYGDVQPDGAAHGDELISLFYSSKLLPQQLTLEDLRVSKQMVKFWTSFATYGTPDHEGQTWKPVSTEDIEYLHIKRNGEMEMKSKLKHYACKLWNSFHFIEDY